MFGHASRPSRIYAFKCKAPSGDLDELFSQLRLGHRYRNQLVEIELRRRAAVDAAVRATVPDIQTLTDRLTEATARVEAIYTEIKVGNVRARVKGTTAEVKARLKEAREDRRVVARELRAARKAAFADPAVKRALATPDVAARVEARRARKDSGLYWGNYLRVEQGMMAARRGNPPRFRSWSGKGAVTVQVQDPTTWPRMVAAGTTVARVVLRAPAPAADPQSRRSREHPMADFWIRVGSSGRLPVWAVFPFRLPRPVPADACVKWASVFRRVVGTRATWEIQFTLDRESWDHPDNAVAGSAGLDVNWRVFGDRLRVATLVGDDGREWTLFLPATLLGKVARSRALQSIRDRNFLEARARLVAWLRRPPEPPGPGPVDPARELPEEFAEKVAHLGLWTAPARLEALVWWWKDHRIPGDEAIYAELEAWRLQDRHNHNYQDAVLVKAQRQRAEIYRRFAAIVRREYRRVVVEDTDWRELARRPAPDQPSDAAARAYARTAAVGQLLGYVREAVTETVAAPARDTTRRCHVCAHVDIFDQAREVIHTCSKCRTTWDQDRNAAINLLRGVDGHGPFAVVGAVPGAGAA